MYGNKWCAALAVISACALCTQSARAKETDDGGGDDADKSSEPVDWLLGVGVSLNNIGVVGAGVGALQGMLYSAGVERRLTESLWLTGTFRGSYNTSDVDGQWAAEGNSYQLDGQLGLRHVINPKDRFQVSVFNNLGGFYGRASDSESAYDVVHWGVHLDAGLMLDYWVAEVVALRLSTRLLSLGHQRQLDGTSEIDSFFAEVGLSPSFAVGLGF
jgi:hypothetical protein